MIRRGYLTLGAKSLAALLHRTPKSVHCRAERLGVRKRTLRITAANASFARALRSRGMSIRQVATCVGISHERVWEYTRS